MNFDKILNWKLLSGSHEFPGPDGGTCINEAAIVAAGFEYKAVSSPQDLPPCFSQPIAKLAMTINDFMPDDLRQKLMKYVCRLAGSADIEEVEKRREALQNDILGAGLEDVLRTVDRSSMIQSVVNRYVGMKRQRNFSSFDFTDTPHVASCVSTQTLYAELYNSVTLYTEVLADLKSLRHRNLFNYNATMEIHMLQSRLLNLGFRALDVMLSFGNQAQPIETATIEKRFEAIKEKVNATIS